MNRPSLAFVPSPTERSPPSPRSARASRSSPAPGDGAGSGFPGEERGRTRFSRLVPVHWTVVAIATGGGDRGGGSPLPGQNGTRTFLSGIPHPARASWRGYSYVPLWQPPPRPRFLEGIPVRSSLAAPTPPALRAPPPPPPGGRGSHGDSQGKAVSGGGAGGGFSGEGGRASPDLVRPRDLPVQWTVVAIATGGGDRGGGSSPPRAKWYPYVPLRQPPPRPRLRRSSSAPSRGRGQCWR